MHWKCFNKTTSWWSFNPTMRLWENWWEVLWILLANIKRNVSTIKYELNKVSRGLQPMVTSTIFIFTNPGRFGVIGTRITSPSIKYGPSFGISKYTSHVHLREMLFLRFILLENVDIFYYIVRLRDKIFRYVCF